MEASSCSLFIDLEQKKQGGEGPLVYSGGSTLKGVVRLELSKSVEMTGKYM